jgi:hypothetical protein
MSLVARISGAHLSGLLMCGLSWLATAQGASTGPSTGATDIAYENPERTFRNVITETTWTVGPIVAATPLQSQAGSNPFTESIWHPVVDCSDPMYRCVQSWSRTIAIPRAGLKSGLKYEKDGVLFDVETCLRGDVDRCQVALVSAKCEGRSGDGTCSHSRSTHKEKPARFEYVMYFLYNEDVGVTAMGIGNQVASTLSAKRAVATQSVLVGVRGLLGK